MASNRAKSKPKSKPKKRRVIGRVHHICQRCYDAGLYERVPVAVPIPLCKNSCCCFCGKRSTSPIFVRTKKLPKSCPGTCGAEPPAKWLEQARRFANQAYSPEYVRDLIRWRLR